MVIPPSRHKGATRAGVDLPETGRSGEFRARIVRELSRGSLSVS